MAGFQVAVKYGKVNSEIDFANSEATIGELHDAIEQKLSVPKAQQSLICAGKRWQGVAFPDTLKILEAAGPKGAKDVMGVKVISLMLMAPAGADGAEEVTKWRAKVDEVEEILSSAPSDSAARKKALALADDLLSSAAQGLDCLQLVGAMRERRREILKRIEAIGNDVSEKRAAL
eukprot:gnl/TRDRNA2_/TRDRNA2_37077_c0_seq1.p1 gnl/TRDRNA2_/TRDRNA2_37077_c0~~gnl/TRDRNA2_/TRDRNA2_37077_c0_seq1.p1  ORF type:complete len:175 (+),score=45.74 gnl/TRDRNA2_/TRDRNA2_37077_c0_seq1:116-640(+)